MLSKFRQFNLLLPLPCGKLFRRITPTWYHRSAESSGNFCHIACDSEKWSTSCPYQKDLTNNSLFLKLPNYVEVRLSCQQVRVNCAVAMDHKLCVHLNSLFKQYKKECLESYGFWYRIVRCGIAVFRRNISLLSSGYRVELVVRNKR